jgi:hypothetical protein
MYCEKVNEIAVMGIRRSAPVEQYRPLIAQFKAVRIQEALTLPLAFGFSELPSQWRDGLTTAYATDR